jgi:hypothetical protein
MSGESTSRTTGTCIARPMAYMCRLFRGIVLGLEVQCLKVLGLKLRDHVVVVPSGVQVMIEMILDPHGGGFGFYPLADHVFLMVTAPSGPRFPFRSYRFTSWPRMSDFLADPFSKQMAQHWYTSQFTNPSVESFAYPIPFY